MEYFSILLNQNYLSLNDDQCYVFNGKTTQEITDNCDKINGYLPKYRDMVMPQGDQGTLFDTLATLDSERNLADSSGFFDLSDMSGRKPGLVSQDKASFALQWVDYSYGLCEHRNIDSWNDTHEWYASRRGSYVTFELDILPYTATRDEHGKLVGAPHETGQIIAQTYCRRSGRFQLFQSIQPERFRKDRLNRNDARTTYFIALLLCEKLLSSAVVI